MRILLTNDDGIDAPGINILGKYLKEAGHELTWSAPLTQQSAASHSITLHKPISTFKHGEKRYAVDGRPTDSVLIAYHNYGPDAFDLVISGINKGQNLAEDILYSGTVAAAVEACFLGYKSIAVSMTSFVDLKFETGAHYIVKLIESGIVDQIKPKEVLNINVPNVDIADIKGYKITHPGHREYENFVTEIAAPKGNKLYWIAGEVIWGKDELADTCVVQENYISISPIFPDFSKKEAQPRYEEWLNNIK